MQNGRYDLQPLLEIAQGTLSGEVASTSALFERVAKACVLGLPCQAADILIIDRQGGCLRRVCAAFRRADGRVLQYSERDLEKMQRQATDQVRTTIESALEASTTDPFMSELQSKHRSGAITIAPIDVNRYSLEHPSMSAAAMRQPIAYDDLRAAYLRGAELDPLYVLAYETVHHNDLEDTGHLLRSMLVAGFCSPFELTLVDGTRILRGDVIGKLRLLNRTIESGALVPGGFSPFEHMLGSFISRHMFIDWMEFKSRPIASVPSHNLLGVKELPTPTRIIEGTQIIGACEKLKRVMELAAQVARRRSVCVLLTGETGTGKGALAKAIHDLSERRLSPFSEITCHTISDGLFESELFGHEKGAFTNAEKLKLGLLEVADKGTVFLDEIGEISPTIQAKLLRFLDKKHFRRVGGIDDIAVDVRIIAATNRRLHQEVEKGAFREDLFQRLNVIPIELPPLRDRGDDILMLLRYLLEKQVEPREQQRLNNLRIHQEVLTTLRYFHWNGNVRSLSNAVEYMLTITSGEVIGMEHLPRWLVDCPERRELSRKPEDIASLTEEKGRGNLRDKTNEVILEMIRQCRGEVTKAAKMLHVGRSTLVQWIRDTNLQSQVDAMRPSHNRNDQATSMAERQTHET